MKTISNLPKLKRSFYKNDVLTVARNLLGKILVHKFSGKLLIAKIVEVEAYDGSVDEAAHTFTGRTKRNEVMFNEGGYLYVYLSYGVHYCCNVVTGKKDEGTAVLIRAVQPLEGINIMMKNRYGRIVTSNKEIYNLTSGPGKVCKAMSIDISNSGLDLLGGEIYLLNQRKIKDEMIGKSKRIGISKSKHFEWRFFIKDNPFLSR